MANEVKSVSLIAYSAAPSLTSSDSLVLTNKGYVDGLWGLSNWSAGDYSNGSLVLHNGKIYKANGDKTESDTTSPNGSGSGWSEVTLKTVFDSMGSTYTAGNGIDITNNAISLDATALGLGTAAYLTAGTSANNVLQLNASGLIPDGVLPNLAVVDVFTASSEALRYSSDNPSYTSKKPRQGDICLVSTGTGASAKTVAYILTTSAENSYTTDGNWVKLSVPSGVVSVNSKLGDAITLSLSDIYSNGFTTSVTQNSDALVTSGAVHTAIQTVTSTFGGAQTYSATTSVTQNSDALVTSGAVWTAINGLTYSNVGAAPTSAAVPDPLASGKVLVSSGSSGDFTFSWGDVPTHTHTAAQLPCKYQELTADGLHDTVTFAHGMTTEKLLVQVYEKSGNNYNFVLVDTTVTSSNITLNFATKPANNTVYRVYIYPVYTSINAEASWS